MKRIGKAESLWEKLGTRKCIPATPSQGRARCAPGGFRTTDPALWGVLQRAGQAGKSLSAHLRELARTLSSDPNGRHPGWADGAHTGARILQDAPTSSPTELEASCTQTMEEACQEYTGVRKSGTPRHSNRLKTIFINLAAAFTTGWL